MRIVANLIDNVLQPPPCAVQQKDIQTLKETRENIISNFGYDINALEGYTCSDVIHACTLAIEYLRSMKRDATVHYLTIYKISLQHAERLGL